MRRITVVLVVALVTAGWFQLPPDVDAVTCGGEPYVVLYEQGDYGTTHNYNSVICYPNNVPDFVDRPHGVYGCIQDPGRRVAGGNAACIPDWEVHLCTRATGNMPARSAYGSWDNCVSSIRWRSMPSNGSLRGCFYINTSYSGLITSRAQDANLSLVGVYGDDTISSFRWRSTSSGC